MTQTTIDLDAEVQRYTELSDAIAQLDSERAAIKARLREALEVGSHLTTFGIGVTVSEPSRSFNLAKAWELLTPEQQALCLAPDAKKVKSQLSGVLVESLMEPGKGDPVVRIG